jgi:alpha-D-ribose 1-methylphosphonate 5-triphosphate synthase subunit PhnI
VQLEQIEKHLQIAVGRVMAEGGLVDPELAALSIKQAEGDVIEAAFLMRAYRSTLPRLGYSHATNGSEMLILRRISSVFRDIPGGQVLGLTRDYTQRLLNFELVDAPGGNERSRGFPASAASGEDASHAEEVEYPLVIDFLRAEGLMAPAVENPGMDEPFDVTRHYAYVSNTRSGCGCSRGERLHADARLPRWGWRNRPRRHPRVAGHELPVRISHPITGRAVTIGTAASEVHYIAGSFASNRSPHPRLPAGPASLPAGTNARRSRWRHRCSCACHGRHQPVANQVRGHVDSVESSGLVEHPAALRDLPGRPQRARKFRELRRRPPVASDAQLAATRRGNQGYSYGFRRRLKREPRPRLAVGDPGYQVPFGSAAPHRGPAPTACR